MTYTWGTLKESINICSISDDSPIQIIDGVTGERRVLDLIKKSNGESVMVIKSPSDDTNYHNRYNV